MEPPNSELLYRTIEWQQLNKAKFIAYNSFVFFFVRAALHPANVVKTRFQMQRQHDRYKSSATALIHTFKTGGIRGLYAGFGTASLMLCVQQIYFVTYESLRSPHSGWTTASEPVRNGLSAAAAVLFSQLFASPIDVVSQRLMLREQLVEVMATTTPNASARIPRGALEAAQQVYRLRGVRGFYTGFTVSCAQYVPASSLWWTTYPLFRGAYSRVISKTLPIESPTQSDAPAMLVGWHARAAEVFAGSSSSAVVAVATAPLDIIRTRAQVTGQGGLAVARQILQAEGIRGLWKGVGARLATLVPQGAVSVSAYEQVKRWSELD